MNCLELQGLSLEVGAGVLWREIDLTIGANQCWALLGRNGAGKTSLLHSIIGIHRPDSGAIRVEQQDLTRIPRRRLATRVGILFQDAMSALPATVMETVMLGRHPHARSLLRDSGEDREIVRKTLVELELEPLAERQVDTLSGGERQRLAFAMLLAQAPGLYLLDEPGNHLDVAYQVKLLQLLRQRVAEQRASMLMATHDINLAWRFCDHVLLLMQDGAWLRGPKQQVLTEANLQRAYGCPMRAVDSDGMMLFHPAAVVGA